MKALTIVSISVIAILCAIQHAQAQSPNRRRPTTPAVSVKTPEPPPVSVILKDGQTIKCKFVSATAEKLTIILGTAKQELNISDVVSLIFSETAPPPTQSPDKSSAIEAINALHKLDSATSVGVNYLEYNRRLIDAKSIVDDSLRRMTDGDVKDEIKAALSDYQFASTTWHAFNLQVELTWESNFIKSGDFTRADSGIGKSLVQLYKVKTFDEAGVGQLIAKSDALSSIWESAKGHVERAEKSVK